MTKKIAGKQDNARIIHISLDEEVLVARSADIEHERRVAIFDLIESNHFQLIANAAGPYRVVLSLIDKGIKFAVRDEGDALLQEIEISMSPFRRRIRDYFLICESYFEAIRTAAPQRIETIDQARRSLHNEGAALLQSILGDAVKMDMDTARRLFTLISVLQIRG